MMFKFVLQSVVCRRRRPGGGARVPDVPRPDHGSQDHFSGRISRARGTPSSTLRPQDEEEVPGPD